MKIYVAILIMALMPILARAGEPEVVQLSPDTYMITKEDHGGIFGSLAKMKVKVIKQANEFAASKGKIAIPLASSERPLGRGPAQWASFEYQFRVVDKDDPEAQRTSLVARPDVVVRVEGEKPPPAPAPTPAASSVREDDKYAKLLKLDDLRKRGIITEDEFKAEKKKILDK